MEFELFFKTKYIFWHHELNILFINKVIYLPLTSNGRRTVILQHKSAFFMQNMWHAFHFSCQDLPENQLIQGVKTQTATGHGLFSFTDSHVDGKPDVLLNERTMENATADCETNVPATVQIFPLSNFSQSNFSHFPQQQAITTSSIHHVTMATFPRL